MLTPPAETKTRGSTARKCAYNSGGYGFTANYAAWALDSSGKKLSAVTHPSVCSMTRGNTLLRGLRSPRIQR
jgi:hypothetical protein